MIHDSRRYHYRANPERLRFYGKNQQQQSVTSPFGGLPQTVAGRISRQAISPLLLGLGVGTGPAAQRLQQQIASGQASGPLASAIQQIQQFAPGVISGATGIGQQIGGLSQSAYNQLAQSIAGAQQQLPQWQQASQAALQAAQQGLTGAQGLFGGMQGMMPGLLQAGQGGLTGAQQAMAAAQGALGGPAQQGMQAAMNQAQNLLTGGAAQAGATQGLNLAQRYAQQMASPIQGEDLYQQAARRVMQSVGAQAGGAGLAGGGAGQQMQYEALTGLAGQMAQQQAANRQASLQGLAQQAGTLGNLQQQAIQGLTGAAGGLGNITQQGIQGALNAAQGVQQAAMGQAGIYGTQLPFLQALQQSGQDILGAAQGGAQMAMYGPQLAQQQMAASQQLGQALMSQYQLPMQAAGGLLNLLTGGVSPGLSLTQATAPITTSSGKGTNIL
ncbi:MAG TPA: hypothetical protein VKB20_11815 [Steroidobacteraceae bacterium]|nr:hypothetical protein [Steroidobacteraceae bacterium]